MAIIDVDSLGMWDTRDGSSDTTVGSGGTSTPGTGATKPVKDAGGSGRTVSGTLNAIEFHTDFAVVPTECQLAISTVDSRTLAALNDGRIALEALPPPAFTAPRAAWRSKYPFAPDPVAVPFARGNMQRLTAAGYMLARPDMDFDPECLVLGSPEFVSGSNEAQILAAAMCMFFPDKVYTDWCESAGQKVIDPKEGSRILSGGGGRGAPFPWRLPFVNNRMIDFAVEYISTVPDAFGSPATKQNFDATSELLRSAAVAGGAATAGPMTAAVAGAATFAWRALTNFFGNSCAEKPEWFSKLLRIIPLRDGSDYAHTIPYWSSQGYKNKCWKLGYIARGTWNLVDAYAEVLRRAPAGQAKKSILWLLLGTAGAAYALTS